MPCQAFQNTLTKLEGNVISLLYKLENDRLENVYLNLTRLVPDDFGKLSSQIINAYGNEPGYYCHNLIHCLNYYREGYCLGYRKGPSKIIYLLNVVANVIRPYDPELANHITLLDEKYLILLTRIRDPYLVANIFQYFIG